MLWVGYKLKQQDYNEIYLHPYVTAQQLVKMHFEEGSKTREFTYSALQSIYTS